MPEKEPSMAEPAATLPDALAAKHEALKRIFTLCDKVLVAYSGGIDSTLILKVATDVLGRERAVGVIAQSETLTSAEFDEAMRVATEENFNVRTIRYSELEIENYSSNPLNRCYFCKSELYERLQEVAREIGAQAICNGDNFDDIGDYRPGAQAAAEANVMSPLKAARLGKDDIRTLGRHLGLPNWNKPSGACLSSRIPYGQTITTDKLAAVGQGEAVLRELGLRQVRVRHHGEIARIEVLPEEMPRLMEPAVRERLVQAMKALGFAYVTLDLQGYRTGSMNETIGRKD